MSLLFPWVLLLLLPAGVALWLLERWRRQPRALLVADVELFRADAASEAESKAAEQRASWRLFARLLALACAVLALAGPERVRGSEGALVVDLVCDRSLSSGARDDGGEPRLARHVRALSEVVERLRPDDRVRLHLLPGASGAEARRSVDSDSAGLLDPNAARARLAALRPAGAESDLEAALGPLTASRGPAPSAPATPVFCASDRRPRTTSPRLALALSGAPYSSRGVVALSRDGAEALVVVRGAPGPVEVTLGARLADSGELLSETLRGELKPGQDAILAWREQRLAQALELSARLVGEPDANPIDDVGFAVASPVPERRVGLVGSVAPALERALRAVGNVALVRGVSMKDTKVELLVASELPEALPSVPLLVVPRELRGDPVRGGPLRAAAPHPAFAHTLGRLASDPARVDALAPLPEGLPRARPLLLAGEAPLALVAGEPPEVVVLLAPAEGPWTQREVFPLLCAELLAAVAPRSRGELRGVAAGASREDGSRAPWGPPQRVLERGVARLGTVAAPARPPEAAVEEGFPPGAFAALGAARPPAPRQSLAPWCALAALLFALLGAAPGASAPTHPRVPRASASRA